MKISRRKHETRTVVGVPRELSNRRDSYWRDRCVSRVIADRPMSAATKSKPLSDLRFTKFRKLNLSFDI
jgi:hypothetical protein